MNILGNDSVRARKGEKDMAAAARCVGHLWECGERRGNMVFVKFRGRRGRVLIVASSVINLELDFLCSVMRLLRTRSFLFTSLVALRPARTSPDA